MASTYGWVRGSKGAATRCGGKEGIDAQVQTWEGSVHIHLQPDGNCYITVEGKIKPDIVLREIGVVMSYEDFETRKMVEKL